MPRRTKDIRATCAIEIVETAYRLGGTESEWIDALLVRARRDLDMGCGVYAFTGDEEIPNLQASPVFVQHDLDLGFAQRVAELNRDAPSDIYELLRARLVTCGGLVQTLGTESPVVEHFRRVLKPTGINDGFSMFARDVEGGSVTMSAPSRSVLAPAPRVRGIWRKVGLHVAAALRLRRKLVAQATARDALLEPSGKMQDASASIAHDETARRVLTRAVQAMEQARSSKVRSSPERALALWQGLVAGEWSLVEQWESDGRRYLAAYRNRPEVRDPRALTPTERSMLKYLALGATNKDIVFTLGIPAGTVSSSVTHIMKKLRAKRRVDLAIFADPSRMERLDVPVTDGELGVLTVDARPRGAAAELLSAAELEVAGYVMRGWSNERIAVARQVSVRTIANQLRAIYEKVGIMSRNQLARAMTT